MTADTGSGSTCCLAGGRSRTSFHLYTYQAPYPQAPTKMTTSSNVSSALVLRTLATEDRLAGALDQFSSEKVHQGSCSMRPYGWHLTEESTTSSDEPVVPRPVLDAVAALDG